MIEASVTKLGHIMLILMYRVQPLWSKKSNVKVTYLNRW